MCVRERERHPLPLSLKSGGIVSGMINRSLCYPCQQPKIESNQRVSDGPWTPYKSGQFALGFLCVAVWERHPHLLSGADFIFIYLSFSSYYFVSLSSKHIIACENLLTSVMMFFILSDMSNHHNNLFSLPSFERSLCSVEQRKMRRLIWLS